MASITASPGCHSVRVSKDQREGGYPLCCDAWAESQGAGEFKKEHEMEEWFASYIHHTSWLVLIHQALSQGPETPGFLTWPLGLYCCFPCHGGLHMLILVYTLFWHGLIMSHEFIYHFNINDSHIQRNSYHKVMTSLTSPEQFSPGTPFSKCQN